MFKGPERYTFVQTVNQYIELGQKHPSASPLYLTPKHFSVFPFPLHATPTPQHPMHDAVYMDCHGDTVSQVPVFYRLPIIPYSCTPSSSCLHRCRPVSIRYTPPQCSQAGNSVRCASPSRRLEVEKNVRTSILCVVLSLAQVAAQQSWPNSGPVTFSRDCSSKRDVEDLDRDELSVQPRSLADNA